MSPLHSRVPFGTSGHRTPQPPQFSTLSRIRTQLPLQRAMSPPLQLVPQTPFEHVGAPSPLELHTFPQAPQFDVSRLRSTHDPEQSARPSSQSEPLHDPAMHISPSAHAVSQLPQCARSRVRSTHIPPQSVWPARQLAEHIPSEQASPAAQLWPQPPQCLGLTRVSTQVVSQSAKPASQTTLHVPPEHVAVA